MHIPVCTPITLKVLQVVEMKHTAFWLLTLGMGASLNTGRHQEPMTAAAILLAAEAMGYRHAGRSIAIGALN